MWYKVDYKRLVILLLPSFLRKPVIIGYIQSLISPIESLYDDWSVFRSDSLYSGNLYKVQHTGQICYLRKALNDRFDSILRRITIGDGNRFKRKYLFTIPENRPEYLGTLFLHQNSDYADTGVDFIVWVPTQIINQQPYELKAVIDFYKAGGKRYKIEKL